MKLENDLLEHCVPCYMLSHKHNQGINMLIYIIKYLPNTTISARTVLMLRLKKQNISAAIFTLSPTEKIKALAFCQVHTIYKNPRSKQKPFLVTQMCKGWTNMPVQLLLRRGNNNNINNKNKCDVLQSESIFAKHKVHICNSSTSNYHCGIYLSQSQIHGKHSQNRQ